MQVPAQQKNGADLGQQPLHEYHGTASKTWEKVVVLQASQ